MKPEKIVCPKCQRALRSLGSFHYCKQVDIDDLFLNKPDNVLLAFDRLYKSVSTFENIDISGTKSCIVFVRNKTFLVAKPMAKCLEIKFYAKDHLDDEELYKCQLWNSKYECVFRIQDENQLKPKLLQYFNESYQIS
jgi:hypothetical protein